MEPAAPAQLREERELPRAVGPEGSTAWKGGGPVRKCRQPRQQEHLASRGFRKSAGETAGRSATRQENGDSREIGTRRAETLGHRAGGAAQKPRRRKSQVLQIRIKGSDGMRFVSQIVPR